MALVGNGVRLSFSNPMRQLGAPQHGTQHIAPMHGALRNAQFGAASVSDVTIKSGVPNGYRHPGAWVPPQRAGGLSSYNEVLGDGDITTANLAGGVNGECDIAGSGALSPAPSMQLIVQAVCAIAGSGALTADIVGKLSAAATLAGSGAVTASLGALASAVCSIIGTGTVAVDATAYASMSCDITSVSELSPQSLAAAVWNSLVTSFQDAGTMGEAMATAGSGGLSPTQVTMLTELYRLAGLDATRPLVVTATTRDAGAEIDQTIVEAPAGTVTVTRT